MAVSKKRPIQTTWAEIQKLLICIKKEWPLNGHAARFGRPSCLVSTS